MSQPFSARRKRIALDLLDELNVLTGGEIARKVVSAGRLRIVWKKKLPRRVSGRLWVCRDGSYIMQLSEHYLTNETRVRNTVAHEWCHLAASAISGCKTEGHGSCFWWWAEQVNEMFKHRGIRVTRYHEYKIEPKCSADTVIEVQSAHHSSWRMRLARWMENLGRRRKTTAESSTSAEVVATVAEMDGERHEDSTNQLE